MSYSVVDNSVQLQQHPRIPLALEPEIEGLFKICENCGRNFFRCRESVVEHCCSCRSQLHTPGNQLWSCIGCGTARAWGEGLPAETNAKDLRCSHCREVTLHEFWKVA